MEYSGIKLSWRRLGEAAGASCWRVTVSRHGLEMGVIYHEGNGSIPWAKLTSLLRSWE